MPGREKKGDKYVYSHKWAKASRAFRRAHPVCAMCPAPSACVDHIEPHAGDMRKFWDRNNWQALCWSCHTAKTKRDETGKPMSGADITGAPIDPTHHWND